MNESDEGLLDIVDVYASSHAKFDNSFAMSLRDALCEYGELTSNQRSTLENIIKKFRMK